MKKHIVTLGLTVGLFSLAPLAAHADVTWEHAGNLSVGKKPLVTFNMKNEWSGANHRTKVFINLSKLSQMMPSSRMHTMPMMGEASLIARLDDDRFLAVIPAAKAYIDEPLSTLPSRLRLKIWPAEDDSLNEEIAPALTLEQRRRLGRELRAALRPITQRTSRTYFRELPGMRTIDGMECHGYRYTSMFNAGVGDRMIAKKGLPAPKGDQWISATGEWWMADNLPGDEEIAAYTSRFNKIKSDNGPLTVSMWANETFPILWQAAPEETHMALESLVGRLGDPGFGFKGTPVEFTMTVTPPPAVAFATGEIRLTARLKSRTTDPIAPANFDAPKDLKRQPIEPGLRILQNLITQGEKKAQSMLDSTLGKAPATKTTVKKPVASQPVATAPTTTMTVAANGLKIEDSKLGTGPAAKDGDTLTMNYRGTLLDGKEFDSSLKPGRDPFQFTLGAGQVIAGWDQGIKGMQVGGKRKLTIPADLAYGDRSPSPDIPAGSTLVFEVELLKIN